MDRKKEPTKRIAPSEVIKSPKRVETLVIHCDLQSYDFISGIREIFARMRYMQIIRGSKRVYVKRK